MLHEYAVEPHALATWNPLWQALEQFGIAHGRMITQFPKKWQKMVYEATINCPAIERAKLEVRLQQLKDKLISSRRPYDPSHTWRDNARSQMTTQAFHAIIQSDNPQNDEFILTESDLHTQTPRWNVSSQQSIARQPSDMANCIVGLCSLSQELLFVDPHFSTDRRFTQVLEEFIRVAHSNGQNYRRIELHTGTKYSKVVLESDCKKWIMPRLPSGVSIKFYMWQERISGEKFHARYVLTERGGIRFDVGLDSGDAGQTTDVSLLTNALHSLRWADFQLTSAAYDLVDQFVITGL